MEIKLSHIKTAKLNDVSINIPSSVITGVTGTNQEEILKVISFSNEFSGNIYFDKERVTKKKQDYYKSKIYYVPLEFNLEYPLYTVEEYLRYFILSNSSKIVNIDEKVVGALKIVGLDKSLLKRTITTLSSSEKKWFQLSLAFLYNPEILKDGKLYQEGLTESIYYYLFNEKELGYELPKIVSFIKLVEKMRKIKLDHRKDIKDLMKDIYREVK